MKPGIAEQLSLQYITDKEGHKTAVILDIAVFEKLLSQMEDLCLGNWAEKVFADDLSPDKEQYSLEEIEKELLGKK